MGFPKDATYRATKNWSTYYKSQAFLSFYYVPGIVMFFNVRY